MKIKNNFVKVIIGFTISIIFIFAPCLLGLISNEQLINNSNPLSVPAIEVYLIFLISVVIFIMAIFKIKNGDNYIGVGLLIPSLIFVLLLIYILALLIFNSF